MIPVTEIHPRQAASARLSESVGDTGTIPFTMRGGERARDLRLDGAKSDDDREWPGKETEPAGGL